MPRLHVVTDDAVLTRSDFLAAATGLLEEAGPDLALHLRGPATPGRVLHDLATALLPAARSSGARLLLNDRLDIACAVGADGVHLGQRSLSPPEARRQLGEGLVGVSCHGDEEVRRVEAAHADVLFCGHVFPSPSHPDRAPLGVDGLGRLVAAASVPVVAIGGVTADRVAACVAAGAVGIAAISGIWGRRSPHGAASEYISGLRDA